MRKRGVLKEILNTSIYILFVLLITIFVVKFVCQKTEVVGDSMESTLSDGDNLIVEKVSYEIGNPERFDVIVFPSEQEKIYLIKRIIGMPGETIYINNDGKIFINDVLLEESFGLEKIENPGNAIMPIVLDEDEYFVLGDNRNNSLDSRFSDVGNVKRDKILGRAWWQIWPVKDIHGIK